MYKFFKNLWEEKHSVWDILTQCCFMFVAAFALLAYAMPTVYTGFGNVLINLLSFLIVAEISQSLISGYFAYRKENL